MVDNRYHTLYIYIYIYNYIYEHEAIQKPISEKNVSLDDCSITYHYQLTIKRYELPINGSPFINNNRRYMFPVSANILFSALYRINFITGIPMASCVHCTGYNALVLSVTLYGQIM